MYKNYFLKNTWKTIKKKQSKGEENNKRRAHTSTRLKKKKKYWGLHCFYSVHDYQRSSLSLN